jgi:hypothetical protein
LGKDGGRLYSMGYIGPRPFSIASLKVANKNTFPGARRCLRLLVLYQIDLLGGGLILPSKSEKSVRKGCLVWFSFDIFGEWQDSFE